MAPSRPVVYRRSRHLVSYWQGGRLVICNFASGVRVAARPEALAVLDFLKEWRTAKQVRARFGDGSSLLHPFVEATLLERSDRDPPRLDAALSAWEGWNPAAGFFHMATRDVRFINPVVGDRALRHKARVTPPPPAVKTYPGARRARFRPWTPTVPRRTSCSSAAHGVDFPGRPLCVLGLGGLLGLTSGVQQWATLRGQGDLPLKTSPSGGARHPIETPSASGVLTDCARSVSLRRRSPLPRTDWPASDAGPCRAPSRRRSSGYRDAAVLVFFTAVFARYFGNTPMRGRIARCSSRPVTSARPLSRGDRSWASRLSVRWRSPTRIEEELRPRRRLGVRHLCRGRRPRPAGVVSPSKPKGFPPLRIRPNPFSNAGSAGRRARMIVHLNSLTFDVIPGGAGALLLRKTRRMPADPEAVAFAMVPTVGQTLTITVDFAVSIPNPGTNPTVWIRARALDPTRAVLGHVNTGGSFRSAGIPGPCG